jgi:hypothetical protein
MAARPETLLITEDKKVVLELGRDGKFSAKSTAWEENKVFLEGETLAVFVNRGRWFLVKRAAPATAPPAVPADPNAIEGALSDPGLVTLPLGRCETATARCDVSLRL